MSSIQQYKEYNIKLKKQLVTNQRLRESLERSNNRLQHKLEASEYVNKQLKVLIDYQVKQIDRTWIRRIKYKIVSFTNSLKKKKDED